MGTRDAASRVLHPVWAPQYKKATDLEGARHKATRMIKGRGLLSQEEMLGALVLLSQRSKGSGWLHSVYLEEVPPNTLAL